MRRFVYALVTPVARLAGVAGVTLAASSAFVSGCARSNAAHGFVDASAADSGSVGSSGEFGDGGPVSEDQCSDAAKLVYVLADDDTLYSFRPDTLTFAPVGLLKCPAPPGVQPNSMAIDRSGVAWVDYDDGSLYRVSTSDASCEVTTFVPGQHGWGRFGMAFSSNAAGGSEETLFVAGLTTEANGRLGGQGMATIDLNTFVLSPFGDFSGGLAGQGAELTGSGDGRLFGFFTTSPAQIAEIDKTTGATSNVRQLTGVDTGTDWAFSFWGGDVWFYTADTLANSPADTSDVTRMHSATTNVLQVVASEIGFRIVGAGVSTCAPTTPPK